MVQLLKYLGTTTLEISFLKSISDKLCPDPTLNFRESRNGRFFYHHLEKSIYRTEFQPFILSTEEDFVRHDSNKVRKFMGLNEDLTQNIAFQNLLKIKYYLIHGIDFTKRPRLDYTSKNWITTVFHLRTITTSDVLGEPALEGVHSDGVDHTMTTFLGSSNMNENSAITHIHSMLEKNGTKTHEANPSFILNKLQHRHFLDTIFIIDHERKHSLTPVYPINKELQATRDMLILFTRKPCTTNHISYEYDSIKPHPDYPAKFPSLECLL